MLPHGVKVKSLLERGSMTMEERYYGNARSFNFEQMQRVIPWATREWDHREVTAPIYAQSTHMDPVARMQHLDLFTWMRGDILVKADKIPRWSCACRSSTRWSLRLRKPSPMI